jgi:hypothetical protein
MRTDRLNTKNICLPFLLLAVWFSAVFASAQTAAPVVVNSLSSIEIPTLVTTHSHRPVGDLTVDQFRVKFGDGEAFKPTSLHVEQNEPIALTLLLDASRDSYHDLAQMSDDLAQLTPSHLLPTDNLSVYGVDCAMARSLYNTSPDPEVVHKAITEALDFPKLHDGKSSSACGKSIHLWDDAAIAVAALAKLPGRRVLLIVSSGIDKGSKYDWQTVQKFASDHAVAIFGLRDQRQAEADTPTQSGLSVSRGNGAFNTIAPPGEVRDAVALELLCANTGGLTLSTSPIHRKETLGYFLFMLRSRSILTIPASAYPSSGSRALKVTMPLTPYFVTATGPDETMLKP